MKSKFAVMIRLIVLMGFLFSLIGFGGKPVHAEQTECYWNGDISTDWYTAGNWDCNQVPMTEEYNVVIPSDGATSYPILNSDGVHVNSLIIQTDGILNIDAGFQIGINTNSFINNGTINIAERFNNQLRIYGGTFNNNGTVNFGSNQAWLILLSAGTHSGSFIGNRFNFNQTTERQLNTFTSFSSIDVREIYIQGKRDIDIDGSIDCSKDFTILNNSLVTISTSSIVDLGNVTIDETSQLIFRMTGGSYNPGDFLSISAGETLSGSGTIQTNLSNGGVVSPGLSPGIITVDGHYTQESTGVLEIELGGTTIGTGYDQLIVTGDADLNNALKVTLRDSFVPVLGNSFTVMTFKSLNGQFTEQNLPELGPGLGWDLSYNSQSIVLTVVEAGSIAGTVTYDGDEGFNPITVGLFLDLNGRPDFKVVVESVTGGYDYAFDEVPLGTYYLAALMDLNGNQQPDRNEPYTNYDGNGDGIPDPIILSAGTPDYMDIDFTLDDPNFIFLPLILR